MNVNGLNLHYEVVEGEGPNVLMLHGWTADMHRWDKVVENLKGHYNFILLDLRGHGESDKPENAGYTLDHYVNDVISVINEMNLDKVVVAGHSMGGMIAQKLYFKVPDKIGGLILIGTTAKVVDNFSMKFNTSFALFMFKIAYNFAFKTVLSRAFSNLTPKEEKEKLIEMGLKNTPKYVVIESFRDFVKNFDMRNKLKEIKTPTLILVGENDRMLPPRMSRFLADNIKGAELHIIDEAGHEVMLEKPEEVAKKIDVFLHELVKE